MPRKQAAKKPRERAKKLSAKRTQNGQGTDNTSDKNRVKKTGSVCVIDCGDGTSVAKKSDKGRTRYRTIGQVLSEERTEIVRYADIESGPFTGFDEIDPSIVDEDDTEDE